MNIMKIMNIMNNKHVVHEAMNTGLKKKNSSSPFNSFQNQTFSPINYVSFTINDHSQDYEH